MVPAVFHLGQILEGKVMRDMAIIASRYRMVAAACPRVEMFTHNMAVHAGLGSLLR